MKINNLGKSQVPLISDRDNQGKVEKSPGHFASELLNSQETQYQEKLNKLMEQIQEQGTNLSQAPTYGELKSYRELVRQFIGEAVGRMYAVSSDRGWDRQGRQKMFTIIKKIDNTLSDMAEDVRVGQERQLDIMAKHDAIRGMLVDLYM
ncbi:MAG: YaaR family protein [Sporomusaceae bacterium]|nr:YaaR family protein [Sporomusaceae bacterium]